jgi:hypothetical protein
MVLKTKIVPEHVKFKSFKISKVMTPLWGLLIFSNFINGNRYPESINKVLKRLPLVFFVLSYYMSSYFHKSEIFILQFTSKTNKNRNIFNHRIVLTFFF